MKIVQFSRFGPAEQVAECVEADGPPAPAAGGTLHVPVEATFPIEDIRKALKLANGYRRAGKVLVTPNGPPAAV